MRAKTASGTGPSVLWSAWPETDADSDPSDPDVTYYTEWFVGRWPIGADEPDCRIFIGMGRTAEIIARRVADKLTGILNVGRLRATSIYTYKDRITVAETIEFMLRKYPSSTERCLGKCEWQIVLDALRDDRRGASINEASTPNDEAGINPASQPSTPNDE